MKDKNIYGDKVDMAFNSGYDTYRNNKILTASPAQLTLMLYDGAIKFCNIAKVAIENKDYATANTNIQKAERIIDEFRATLDFKYPVAKDFDNVYKYIFERLIDANIHKDNDILDEALGHLRTMRDTWEEVMRRAKQKDRV